jgi:hypothetical protein
MQIRDILRRRSAAAAPADKSETARAFLRKYCAFLRLTIGRRIVERRRADDAALGRTFGSRRYGGLPVAGGADRSPRRAATWT